jgi:WD40 repeat protein
MVELTRLGHGTLNQMAISPDGQALAVVSSLGVWLYDVETLKPLKLLAEDTGWVYDVAWSPDGSALASANSDNTVRVWDVASGEERRTLKGHTDAVWTVA